MRRAKVFPFWATQIDQPDPAQSSSESHLRLLQLLAVGGHWPVLCRLFASFRLRRIASELRLRAGVRNVRGGEGDRAMSAAEQARERSEMQGERKLVRWITCVLVSGSDHTSPSTHSPSSCAERDDDGELHRSVRPAGRLGRAVQVVHVRRRLLGGLEHRADLQRDRLSAGRGRQPSPKATA